MTPVRLPTTLKALSLISVVLLVGAALGARRSDAAVDDPPNILIFITDDQRLPGTLEVMPKTLSWFADGGTNFTSAVTTTPTCCPARSSIFTGQYAHNHGVRTSERGQAELLDQNTTLQRYLQEAGYRTGLFGKFLNGWSLYEAPPFFDRWAMFATGPTAAYYDGTWNVNGTAETVERYSTDYIADRAGMFLGGAENSDDQPWLMYVTPLAPHPPSIPEPDYEHATAPDFVLNPAMLETDRSDKPPWVLEDPPKNLNLMATKYHKQVRTLMSVDDLVDKTMQTLEKLGEAENTLAIFISDNGYVLGEHGLGGKTYPYSPSIEVPLLVRWPGHVAEGTTDNRLVANIDIAPTIFEALGIVPDHVVDGHSLLDTTYTRDRILLENWRRSKRPTPDWVGLLTTSYQYVEHYTEESDRILVEFTEYYDLVNDPYQLENLLGDTDDGNDPETLPLSIQVLRDKQCAGTSGPEACP